MCYEVIEKSLDKLISKNRLPQSFIFYGRNISEIERISKEFSLKILGTKVKNFRDIFEFKCDKRIISVDDIRFLNIELMKKPEASKNKVILIYNADKMTVQAQNSFLKSLEDSNENIFIILIVNNIRNIIDTVLSRCLLIKFSGLKFNEYCDEIKNYDLSKDDLNNFYFQTNGDIDLTKSLLNKGYTYKMYLHIMKLFKCLCENHLINVFEFGNEINNYKDCIDLFLECVIGILRDIFVYKSLNEEDMIYNKYFLNLIVESSRDISFRKIYNTLNLLSEFRLRVRLNLNVEMCYKIFILKINGGAN